MTYHPFYFLRLASLALLYALLAKLVLAFFTIHGAISILWPSSGLALAALLIGGKKYWPGVFIGALVGNTIAGTPAWVPVAIASGSTLETLAGLWLLSRIDRFDSNLSQPRDFLWLGLAGALSAWAGALIGVGTLVLSGFITQQELIPSLVRWWQGDTFGIVLFTPLLLVWRQLPQGWFRRERVMETTACFGLAFLTGQIIFLGWFHDVFGTTARGYWMFLFVVWGAARFGRHGALLTLGMTAVQMLLGIVLQAEGFTSNLVPSGLLNLWFYMLALTVVGMVLAVSIEREHKLAETALSSGEERMRATLESVLDAIITISEWGIVESFNKSAERIFGYRAEEVIGRNVNMLMPEPYHTAHDDYLHNYMVSGVKKIIGTGREVVGRRKDGSIFPLNLAVTEMSLGERRMFVGSARDITKRKQAEQELQLAAMVYRAIGEAIMVSNANNQIIAINPAFTQLTGYTEQEAIGQSTKLLTSGRQDKDFYRHMWHTIDLTGRWQGEIWNRRKNGEVYREWMAISTIYDENGTVQQRVAMYSEITDQKLAEQTIWQQANFDPLTGLPNRRTFHDRLDQEMKRAHRTGLPLALMYIDLDRFKEVNDTLGHDMGDALLKEATNRLSSCVRETDTVSRLGGDEFTVILGELDNLGSIDRIAQDILHRLSEPFQLGDEVAHVSASIGITLYPEDATEIDELIKNADQAMYASKDQGRNCYSYFAA